MSTTQSPEPRSVPGYGQVPEPVTVSQSAAQQELIAQQAALIAAQSAKPVKQSRDKAQYVRKQKGHSLTLHILLGGILLWIPTIYYACSPRHYFHA